MIKKENIRYIVIAGATFVYKDNNVGLFLGVQMELTNGYTLEFKTPVKRLDMDNPDLQESTNWEDRYTKLAMKLGEEILLYAQGKRAQTNFEFTETKEDSNSNELAAV
jgi:Zn/Cd-binding protein ZinT